MEGRMFLVGSAVAAAGRVAKTALAKSPPAAGQLLTPSDLAEFDPAYVENVIVPHFPGEYLAADDQLSSSPRRTRFTAGRSDDRNRRRCRFARQA
jgi:hypothetical protein